MSSPTLKTVDIDELRESPFNPRRTYGNLSELAATMKDGAGIRQPPLARPTKDGLELVFGHRRVRAAKLAGIKRIQVQVRDLSDAEAMEEQLIENAQREDIHPMDEAEAFGKLRAAYGQKKTGERFVEDLSKHIGRSRAFIFGRLKLLDLPEDLRERFRKNHKLSADGVLEICALQGERLQTRAMDHYETGGPGGEPLSVRKLRAWVRDAFKDAKRGRGGKAPLPSETRELLERTANIAIERMVASIERERFFEHHQVKLMALALIQRGASARMLKRRGFGSADQLERAAEKKYSPAELRGLAFELAVDSWVRTEGDDYGGELKAMAKAFGLSLKDLEEAVKLLGTEG